MAFKEKLIPPTKNCVIILIIKSGIANTRKTFNIRLITYENEKIRFLPEFNSLPK